MGASTISYIFELLEFSKFIYQLKNSKWISNSILE